MFSPEVSILLGQHFRTVDEYDYALGQLRVHIVKQEDELMVEKAYAAGLKAELEAWRKAHPDSPLLKPTGMHYEDDSPQRVEQTHFDKAFDAEYQRLGGHAPGRHRLEIPMHRRLARF